MAKLNSIDIKKGLKQIPGWKKQGAAISSTYEFNDFPAAMRFTNAVAKLAEKAQHLTTHDQGGLTEKDFASAKRFEKLLTTNSKF